MGGRGEGNGACRAPCPACRRESRHWLSSRDHNQRISGEAFDYSRCPACGLVFLAGPPGHLADHYPGNYHAIPPSLDQLAARAASEEYKVGIVLEHATGGRLLEVGPSFGAFCWLAKQRGFAVEAIEMDPACCRFLSQTVGIPAVNSTDIVGALEGREPFQVIVLWHVVEHLADPFAVLEALARQLAPGGILVVSSPNPDSFQLRIQRGRWPHLDAPRHVMLIPAGVIVEKMAALGLAVRTRTTRHRGGSAYDTFGWTGLLTNTRAGARARRPLWLVGRALSLLARPLDRVEGWGSSYLLVLGKPG